MINAIPSRGLQLRGHLLRPSASGRPLLSSAFGACNPTRWEAAGGPRALATLAGPKEGGPEGESTAEFTPVVQLDEVEVKTHEEDEEVTFKMRSKLFRFTETLLNKGSGKKEWIERGVGEVKLLKHRESSMIRALMRQEKTMKIIMNMMTDKTSEPITAG